jgi:hypothetical protein
MSKLSCKLIVWWSTYHIWQSQHAWHGHLLISRHGQWHDHVNVDVADKFEDIEDMDNDIDMINMDIDKVDKFDLHIYIVDRTDKYKRVLACLTWTLTLRRLTWSSEHQQVQYILKSQIVHFSKEFLGLPNRKQTPLGLVKNTKRVGENHQMLWSLLPKTMVNITKCRWWISPKKFHKIMLWSLPKSLVNK